MHYPFIRQWLLRGVLDGLVWAVVSYGFFHAFMHQILDNTVRLGTSLLFGAFSMIESLAEHRHDSSFTLYGFVKDARCKLLQFAIGCVVMYLLYRILRKAVT